jgi:hypothetical protein
MAIREPIKPLRDLMKSNYLIGVVAAVAVPFICLAGTAPKVETIPATAEKTEPLSGAQLWAMNCNRCHMYRSSAEFTAAQWQPIMMHMRVRANIPAAQAREILKFLQAGAGK